ncbi:cytochrome P450 4d10-like [Bemisia tabaci]|uniref:cytochrome P450 4d10-like n=1 Tax=Bemisia tabaci TaxID=7038 RepID=UPI003B28A994
MFQLLWAHFTLMVIAQVAVQSKFTRNLWVCLIGALLLRALMQRLRNQRIFAFMAALPGPTGLPFLGAIHRIVGINTTNACRYLKNLCKDYPRNFSIWMCGIPHVLTSDPEAISAILASSENTDKFSHHKCIKTEYPAIVSAQGDEWRNMRKLVNPTFCISNFKVFERNFQYRTNEFLNKLDKHATGEEFDIHLPVHLCTLDLVCDNMIGCEMDVQKNNLEYLSIAMSRAIEMMFERAFQPIFWPDFTYLLSGQQTSFRKTYNPGLDFVKLGIEQRMKARKEGVVATESEGEYISFKNNF